MMQSVFRGEGLRHVGFKTSAFGVRSTPWLALLLLLVAAVVHPQPVLADSTGEHSPCDPSDPNGCTPSNPGYGGAFTGAANALACGGGTATATANNQTEIYSMYGLTLPNSVPAPVVTGIQVRVRANDGTKSNRKLQVSLSWDGGTTYTSGGGIGVLQTRNFRRNGPLKDYILGGPSVLWGRTSWSTSDLSDTNFRVNVLAKMASGGSGDNINLDCIPVTVFYTIPGLPDLGLTKTASPDPVGPTGTLTYTITYSNTGQSTATNVIVSDATPANTTFVSAMPAPTTAPSVGSGGTIIWNVGSVPVGGSGIVTFTVKVNASVGMQIVNDTYSIAGDQNPPSAGSPVSTTVGNAVLTLSKSAVPNPVAPGGTLTYVLTISNTGNVTSTNIVVNESYDGNAPYQSYISTCSLSNSASTPPDQWTITSLAAGASCTITITTLVNGALVDGTEVLNTADLIDDASNTASASAVSIVQQCAGQSDGSPCNDRDVCTQTDTCQSQLCIGSNPVVCTASDQCHVAGTCNPATGCSNPPAADATPCDDANACTSGDACTSGVCAGTPYSCAPPDQCHLAGTCNGDGSCSYASQPDGTTCSDGNACTQTDTCQNGSCVGGNPVACAPLDQCHVAGTCDTGTGLCSNPAIADNTPCDDHNADTCRDLCTNGVCAGSTDPVACVDFFKCYAARTKQGTPRFATQTVTLADEFETKKTLVTRPVQICNPASENNGTTLDATTHLTCYAIRDASTKPRQQRFTPKDLQTTNVLKGQGGDKVRASRPQMVCVPTEQFDTETSSMELDHFKCYAAGIQRGTSRFTALDVPVADEFESKLTKVSRPVQICNPVSESGDAIVRPTAHLECFAIRDATTKPRQSRFTKRDVTATDGFGSETLTVTRPTTMCVPSLTTPMP